MSTLSEADEDSREVMEDSAILHEGGEHAVNDSEDHEADDFLDCDVGDDEAVASLSDIAFQPDTPSFLAFPILKRPRGRPKKNFYENLAAQGAFGRGVLPSTGKKRGRPRKDEAAAKAANSSAAFASEISREWVAERKHDLLRLTEVLDQMICENQDLRAKLASAEHLLGVAEAELTESRATILRYEIDYARRTPGSIPAADDEEDNLEESEVDQLASEKSGSIQEAEPLLSGYAFDNDGIPFRDDPLPAEMRSEPGDSSSTNEVAIAAGPSLLPASSRKMMFQKSVLSGARRKLSALIVRPAVPSASPLATASRGDAKCDLCNKSFRFAIDLRRHQLSHSRPYKCNTCGYGFGRKQHLKRHQQSGCESASAGVSVDSKIIDEERAFPSSPGKLLGKGKRGRPKIKPDVPKRPRGRPRKYPRGDGRDFFTPPTANLGKTKRESVNECGGGDFASSSDTLRMDVGRENGGYHNEFERPNE